MHSPPEAMTLPNRGVLSAAPCTNIVGHGGHVAGMVCQEKSLEWIEGYKRQATWKSTTCAF